MKQDLIYLFKRAGIFLFYYISVILICGILFSHFNFAPTNIENERSLISTIIQSQATIISIVITLSLVAIQITASQYSSKIIDYIKRHPDFWILTVIYIISIIYGLIILRTLSLDNVNYFLGIPLDSYISLELGIAIYSLIILFPYIITTTNLLGANVIIDELSKKIDKKSIITQNEDFNFYFTIINSSMLKNDLEVTTYGLFKINKIIIPIFKNASRDEITQINIAYDEKLRELRSLSQKMNFEYITGYVCNCHYAVAKEVLDDDLPLLLDSQISELCIISKQAIEQNSSLIFTTSSFFLNEIAIKSLEKKREPEYERALEALPILGQLCISYNNLGIFSSVITQLKILAFYQITHGTDRDVARVIVKIGNLLDDVGVQNYFVSLSFFSDVFGEIESEIITKNKDFRQSLSFLSHHEKKVSEFAILGSQIIVLQKNITNLGKLYNYSRETKNDELSTIIIAYFHNILTKGLKSENREIIILFMIQVQKKIAELYIKQKEFKNFSLYIETNRTIALYLIENYQTDILFDLINNLGDLEESLIADNFDDESVQITNLLYLIGYQGIEKDQFDLTFIAPIELLKEMDYDVFAEKFSQKKSPIATVVKLLHTEGVAASNKKLVKTTKAIVIFLVRLYARCAKDGYFEGEEKISYSIIEIGSTSFETGLIEAAIGVITQIDHLLKFAEIKEPYVTLPELIRIDVGFSCLAIEKEMMDVAKLCAIQITSMIPNLEESQINVQLDRIFSRLTDIKEQATFTQFRELYQQTLSEMHSHPSPEKK